MKIQTSINPTDVLRRSGYGLITGRQGQSFVRRLGSNFYPRFHAYVEGSQINLHLDQKQPSYEGSHAHSGEYDGELVESEAERIKQTMERLKEPEIPETHKKKSFWSFFDKND
ncbi:MAG: hypothetical protein AAB791_02210 [Patescibacteria group bacterium]